ncbi:hypothetical protein BIZ83_gp234 [Erwinia phage vB_EamM_ChrisDB]|jgi:hypothetical protein|uniref:hypothetical protein n=1 Tax=Erwinia phage vB_EamM_ChrisDB TaxID=1883371 RepID=UPI00081C66F6|nr:hypothetical protein BIZ83_gp234 [Erwinia phage vB_EamM_ChrisDB]ANZ48619.1 hypothetical protein CHRISDB_57 [Erwinia phage vB_EamM_ChrisDB]
MENLYDDYADVLGKVRQEVRLAPILDLVSLGIDYGYDTTLADIYYQPLPEPNDECIRLEGIIVKVAVALGQRLGIGFNPQEVFKKPKETVRVLHGLLESFDEFEDKDALYGIMCSGEPAQFILENMARHVYGDNELHFEDLIVVVEPRLLNALRNIFAAQSAEDAEEGDNDPRMERIIPYLRQYPANPSAFVFMNLPTVVDLNAVVQSLDFSEENGISEIDLLVMYAVGLSIIGAADYQTAYGQLEENLALINNEDLPEGPILKDAMEGLKAVYAEELENHDED